MCGSSKRLVLGGCTSFRRVLVCWVFVGGCPRFLAHPSTEFYAEGVERDPPPSAAKEEAEKGGESTEEPAPEPETPPPPPPPPPVVEEPVIADVEVDDEGEADVEIEL